MVAAAARGSSFGMPAYIRKQKGWGLDVKAEEGVVTWTRVLN